MRYHGFFAAAVCAVCAPLAVAQPGEVSVVVKKDSIEFKSGTKVVAKYHTAASAAKPYLYPILAPGEVPVTRAWPMEKGTTGETVDHVHQKSAWFCHGDVIPEGIELKVKTTEKGGKGVDFWSESKDKDGTRRHGQMTVVKVGTPQAAKGTVSIETHNEWKSPDGIKILDEVRVLHFSETPVGRLFVFDITLKATVCPIAFGDTKEGSFGIRVHDALRGQLPTGGTVTGPDGKSIPAPSKDNLPVWGMPANWHDYSGTVGGKAVGVAIFDHPANPRACWHTRAYGLMAANPFARSASGFPSQKDKTQLIMIAKDKELKIVYAIYAHTGDVASGKVADAYAAFGK